MRHNQLKICEYLHTHLTSLCLVSSGVGKIHPLSMRWVPKHKLCAALSSNRSSRDYSTSHTNCGCSPTSRGHSNLLKSGRATGSWPAKVPALAWTCWASMTPRGQSSITTPIMLIVFYFKGLHRRTDFPNQNKCGIWKFASRCDISRITALKHTSRPLSASVKQPCTHQQISYVSEIAHWYGLFEACVSLWR